MARRTPALSVFTPVYNGAEFIGRCWQNLRDQTFEDWEWVVVDDGSTDATRTLLEGLSDPRIRFLTYQPNQGRGRARTRALHACAADWVVVWDVDDLHCLDRLAKIHEARASGCDFWCSYAAVITPALEISSFGGFYPSAGGYPVDFFHPTLACRHDLALSIGYDQGVAPGVLPSWESAEDHRMRITLSAHHKGCFEEDVLTLYLADRDICLNRAITCNRSRFRQNRELAESGVLDLSTRQALMGRLRYWVKMAVLMGMKLLPGSYEAYRLGRAPNHGEMAHDWAILPEREEHIRSLCEMYRRTPDLHCAQFSQPAPNTP